jgi:WD40 repeat protein
LRKYLGACGFPVDNDATTQMPPSEPGSIYISYARCDGAELAQRLHADLSREGFNVWLDQRRLEGGGAWSLEIEQEIDTREITLALLTPGSYESAPCRAEQVRTLRRDKRLIPILAAGDRLLPGFIEACQVADFRDLACYGKSLRELVANILGDDTARMLETYRSTTRVTRLTAPPQVIHHIERPEALRELRNALFAENHRRPIALTAMSGMGGLGNTTLARSLIEDDVVQQAFPDGIVWITVGKESQRDFIQEMREITAALGQDLSHYQNAPASERLYRNTLARKAALVVVDDAWGKADIEPLLAESRCSRFLFTTRNTSICSSVDAREYCAELFDVSQSRDLLAAWAGLRTAQLPPEAGELIAECGRLPLAISVIGGALHRVDESSWRATLDRVRNAEPPATQELLPTGQDGFFRAIEVSFQALGPQMQKHYLALAVLLEDMSAPLSVLQALWEVTEADARYISGRLLNRSLAQGDEAGGTIRLHDLQLDYVRARYSDREALKLIHGAIRLSSNIIARDPAQFASQVVGRLLPHQGSASIDRFTHAVSMGAPSPWLRSLWPTLHPPGTSFIRTLKGHSHDVRGVALSSDGRRAVSASGDETLKVWDVESGRALRTLEGHTDIVYGVALSGDGRIAVSASMDETLRVWDVESGQALGTLEGHFAAVNTVAVSEDGRRVVSGSSDHTVKVWDLESGSEVHTLLGHADVVTAVAVSRDGRHAVSASLDQTLKVWDVDGEHELYSLQGHSDVVHGVALSGDGRYAASASADKTLKVWDVEGGRELRTLEGHSSIVRAVAMGADGWRAVSAAEDRTLKVWDLESGNELRSLQGHADIVYGVAVSADGRLAVSASRDKMLKVWDVENGRELRTVEGHSDAVTALAASGDGRRVVSASRDKTLKVWDVGSGHELRTLKGHSEAVTAVAVSEDGRWAISASEDQTLIVWDVESGSQLRTLKGHSDYVVGVALSADGRRAVSASGDESLKIWDVESGRELRTLEGHSPFIYGVALSGDGRRAVSASGDETLQVWDVESGCALHKMDGHSGWVYSVALSGDGQRAVSASRDKTLKVWDVGSGHVLRTMDGYSDYVGAAVSQDGRWAASASLDQTVKVWDVETGVALATFTCDAAAWCCAFLNDRELTAGDVDGRVYLLRLELPARKD